jgi:hypothetical protein
MKAIAPLADMVKSQRKLVSTDNPWRKIEENNANAIRNAWDSYRDARDAGQERLFRAIYESPQLAEMIGFKPDTTQKKSTVHGNKINQRYARYEELYETGSIETGFMRLLIYVASGNGVIDERPFNGIRRLMQELGLDKKINLQQLKETIKQQTYLVRMNEQRALTGLLRLLPTRTERLRALTLTRELLELSGPINSGKEARLAQVAQVLQLNLKPNIKQNIAPVKPKQSAKKNVPSRITKAKPATQKRLKST